MLTFLIGLLAGIVVNAFLFSALDHDGSGSHRSKVTNVVDSN